jgi:hypothetical protein
VNPSRKPLLPDLSPFMQLLFTVLLIIACYSLTFLLGLLLAQPLFGITTGAIFASLASFDDPLSLQLLRYFQVLQSFGLFILPVLVAGFFFTGKPFHALRLDQGPKGWVYPALIVLMFISLPMVNWLITLNESMKLPGFLQEVESWMKTTEDQATQLTDAFLKMPNTSTMLLNLVMIGALPAIGEELLFRGLLQPLLKDWTKNIHLAIFLSAFLFSAMHLQFYGFLPRLTLGLMFGYLFYWTGSLWVPIIAHFVNNSAAVVVSWLGQQGWISGDYEHFGETGSFWFILLRTVATILILLLVNKKGATTARLSKDSGKIPAIKDPEAL